MNLDNINWDFISVCIELANLLIVFIPAVVIFIYYKIHIVNIYTLESADGGVIVGIHNITNKTLYLHNCFFTISSSNCNKKLKYEQLSNKNYIIIKPDVIEQVKIDYKLFNLDKECKIHIILYRKRMMIFKKIK